MKNTWLFPAIQSLHVVGLALFVGILSLKVNKPGLKNSGLALLLLTGLALFFADSTRYLSNSAFLFKLPLTATALLFEYVIRPRWQTRSATVFSLVLWSSVVVASRLIEDFDK